MPDLGNVPAWVSAVVAAAGVIATVVFGVLARGSANAAKASEEAAARHQDDALKAAQAAAGAESRAADAAERLADALEAQARQAAAEMDAAEAATWEVEHVDGTTWQLRNLSDQPKHRVEIRGPGVSTVEPPPRAPKVDGRSSVKFRSTTERSREKRVEVSWYATADGTGEQLSWSDTFPAT